MYLFAISILDFITLTHLPSLVIQVPVYLQFSTCFIGFPFRVILLSLLFSYLLITILSVFFILIDRPFSSLYKSTMSSISCNFSFECATSIISSAYLKLFRVYPPIINPPTLSKCLILISLYKLNRSGDNTHPCLTSLLMCVKFPSSFWYLIAAD